MEKTALWEPWKTLRVCHFPTSPKTINYHSGSGPDSGGRSELRVHKRPLQRGKGRSLRDRQRISLKGPCYARGGKIQEGRAADLAGVSVGQMTDVLAEYGVKAKKEDYLESLEHLKGAW